MHKYFINSAIICFQNAVYGLTGLLSVLIPDMPAGVRTQIQREKLLAREVLFDADLDNDKNKRKANNNFGKDVINKLVAYVTQEFIMYVNTFENIVNKLLSKFLLIKILAILKIHLRLHKNTYFDKTGNVFN